MFFTTRQKLLIVFVFILCDTINRNWNWNSRVFRIYTSKFEKLNFLYSATFAAVVCCCFWPKRDETTKLAKKKNNSNESQLGERIWNETTKCNFSNREIVCTFDHTWTLEAVQFAEFQFRVSSFHSINSISLRAAIFKSFGEQLHTPHNSTAAFNFIRQWKISNFTEYYCSIYRSATKKS